MEIILVQGLGQSADVWQPVQKQLRVPSRTFDVFAGLTPNDSLTLSMLNDKLARDLQKNQTPVILCGLSLGAVLTLMQLCHPATKIVGALVSAPQYSPPNRLLMKAQDVMFRFQPDSAFADLGVTKSQVRTLTDSLMQLDLRAKLATVAVPTTILYGSRDWANRGAAQRLNRLMPQSQLEVLAGGHELNITQPQAFAEAIQQVVERVK